MSFIADRLDLAPNDKKDYPTAEELIERRSKKQLVIRGTEKFNKDPKKGLQFLVENGIITDGNDPKSVASFLRNTSRINKKLLGEYVAKPSNKDIMNCFIDSFKFDGKRIDVALRELLESFRLPGEAQQIERIVEKFSERYCEFSPKDVANKDAAFVLSYSIILLNTDLHNPQVKNRMTFEQYKNNLRSVNDNKDFAVEYLDEIYNAIKHNEIIMPSEHDNRAGFDYAWKGLLQKAHSAGQMLVCQDTNSYDAEMFRATWKPVVATLAYVFTSATDDMVFMRVITGFDHCAQIATRYGLYEVLDYIILCLSKISTLSVEPMINSAADSTEIQVDGSSITVSELSVRFGRNYKAQLATVVLFRVVRGNEHLVRAGWRDILYIWLNLFTNSLISPYFSELQDKLDVPSIPKINAGNVIKKNDAKDNSIFSTLSSYLSSYAVDSPPEPTDEELESTLCTVDCVNSCNLSEIFDNISALDPVKVGFMINSLLEEAQLLQQKRPFTTVRDELSIETSSDPALNSGSLHASSLASSSSSDKKAVPSSAPLSIYVLEMATCLVAKDPACLNELRGTLMSTLKTILSNAENTHSIVIGRIACYMLAILRKVISEYNSEPSPERLDILKDLCGEVFMSIAGVSGDILKETDSVVAFALVHCFRSAPEVIKSAFLNTPEQAFWKTLEALQENSEAAPLIFELAQEITGFTDIDELEARDEKDYRPTLALIRTSENFQAVIDLLGTFASAGSIGSDWEQRSDQRSGGVSGGGARWTGRSATPPVTSKVQTRNNGIASRQDRRNYSTLGKPTSGSSGNSGRNSEDILRGTAMVNGKRMTAAEVNAAVASGTYPGMQRPYTDIIVRAVKAVKMINEFRVYVQELVEESKLSQDEGLFHFLHLFFFLLFNT